MARGTLLVTAGAARGDELAIDGGELLLGRKVEGPGRLEGDREISGRHARLVMNDDGELVIEDLQSSNGTFVNGVRVTAPRRLLPGDLLRLGQTELRLTQNGAATRPPRLERLEPPVTPAHPATQRPGDLAWTGSDRVEGAGRGRRGAGDDAAVLLYAGDRISVGDAPVTVGRAEDNTVCIDSALASRHHARVERTAAGHQVADLDSRNGTYLNGERLHGESRQLESGDTITIATEHIRFLDGQERRTSSAPRDPVSGTRDIALRGERLRLGRDPSNDVVLSDPNVSRFHAEVVAQPSGYSLRDLGSRNGTRLDGEPIKQARLAPGSEIGIGPFRLVFDGAAFLARDDRGALRLAAEEVTVEANGKRILDRASLDVQPGEFVAIIGESGSGKTTLIKALAGVKPPDSGSVRINGEEVSARLSEIGYVPQDEIVHGYLTVREALTYAARLRLPQDSSRSEIKAAVDEVLEELALGDHADTRVASLSGGQRKRAGVGVELVNRPGLLFLDEATTGLDPGLEGRMMKLMRELANRSRAVVTITHATKNLGMCDKVVVMGRGGALCFFGKPEDALRFFEVDDYDEIYSALDATPAAEWRDRWIEHTLNGAPATEQVAPSAQRTFRRPRKERRVGTQAAILAGRYFKLTVRDRRNMLILLGQVPILAFLVSVLFHKRVMGVHAGQVTSATELIFLLATLAVWLGSIDSAREIIKERPVYLREHAVGVRPSAYLISKLTVLLGLASVQTVGLCAVVFLLRPLDEPSVHYLTVTGILVVTSWVAVAMGLLLSSVVNTENQATSFLPLALIPQLLFAGQIKQVHQLPSALKYVAGTVFSRWSFAGLGHVVNFNYRFAQDPLRSVEFKNYGHSFFTFHVAEAVAVLLVFLGIFLFGVLGGLRRQRA